MLCSAVKTSRTSREIVDVLGELGPTAWPPEISCQLKSGLLSWVRTAALGGPPAGLNKDIPSCNVVAVGSSPRNSALDMCHS
jgi:hypothetical protein